MNNCINLKSSMRIGILGGMGPLASSFFHQRLIQIAQEDFNCIQDEDFPEIFHYSIYLKGFDETASIEFEDEIKLKLKEYILKLEEEQVDVIVLPCNSIHIFYDYLITLTQIPILNIIEEVTKEVLETFDSALALCSKTTRNQKLYDSDFLTISYVSEDDCKYIEKTILESMSGKLSDSTKELFLSLIPKYLLKNQCCILACTELPIFIPEKEYQGISILSSTDILARSCLKFVFKK